MEKKRFNLLQKLIIGIICANFTFVAHSQLVVDTSFTPQYLVQNVLLGAGVNVSNIQFTGSLTAIASFNGTNSNIGLTSGLLLSTGRAYDAIGPNNSQNGNPNFGLLGLPGDSSLTVLASLPTGFTTHDAAILEFDFIPQSDSLSFVYVFASEEYPEYVCSTFNDVFAFFLTGPKPGGGNYTSKNIALIPGSNDPVAINNVNDGSIQGGNCISTNTAFYVNNGNGTTPMQNPSVQFDGFTVPMEAKASVIAGQTYHIRIAIADSYDNVFESGVFLLEKSFSSVPQTISAWGSVADTLAYEGCGYGKFTFKRIGSAQSALTIKYKILGDAINGVDYVTDNNQQVKDSIVIPQGQVSATLNIYPKQDNLIENDEKIIIEAYYVIANDTIKISATLIIRNVSPLQITTAPEKTICPANGSSALLAATISGGMPPYTISWNPGNFTQNPVSVIPTESTVYHINVTDTCIKAPVHSVQLVNVICDVNIPNIITPNNDGYNDVFEITNIRYFPKSKLSIYNRWGKEIFSTTAYKNDWNGDQYPDGVYYYILDLGINNRIYNGSLTILRK